jgi:hypothetical protein
VVGFYRKVCCGDLKLTVVWMILLACWNELAAEISPNRKIDEDKQLFICSSNEPRL